MCRPADFTLRSVSANLTGGTSGSLSIARERCGQVTDVAGAESGHARVHVRPVVGALVENLLQVVGLELGADAVERRRHAALVAHLRRRRREESVGRLGRPADLVARVAGVAIQRNHRPGDHNSRLPRYRLRRRDCFAERRSLG